MTMIKIRAKAKIRVKVKAETEGENKVYRNENMKAGLPNLSVQVTAMARPLGYLS